MAGKSTDQEIQTAMVTLSYLNIVLLVAASQGLVLGALIFHKYNRLFANRFLGTYMLLYSLILLNLIFEDLGVFREFPFLFFIPITLPLLIGPLHYWYAKYLTHSSLKFKHTEWLHFLPAFLFDLFLLGYFLHSGMNFPSSADGGSDPEQPFIFVIFNWVLVLQAMTYMILTLLLLKRYSRSIKDVFSTTDKVQLDWLRNITYLVTFVLTIFIMENALLLGGINLSHFFNFSSLLAALAVYVLGYLGLFKSEIFARPEIAQSMDQLPDLYSHVLTSERVHPKSTTTKYEKSGLSTESAKQYLAELIALMEKKKLYRNSDLSLKQLADRLNISPHNLSEVINTRLNKNFFDFVNSYRVEEVKKHLADPKKRHLKILAIAYEAGFNSKASFNTIFKKHTGMTPSAYREKYS